MVYQINKYFKLLGLILKYGHWLHSGEDFNKARNESLKELKDFIPAGNVESTTPLSGNAFIRNLVSQLAFLKQSFQNKGGHLAAANLSYIRIPKSASTSMGKSMLEIIYPALTQKKIDEKQVNYLIDKNLQSQIANDNFTYFTIVRNPFSRLVSVYRSFFENNSANYIYRDYLFGILPQNLSFDDFVDRIACIPNQLKDQHLKQQCYFIEYYKKRGQDVSVFKLEEPERLNQFLSSYNLLLPHLNKDADGYDYKAYFSAKSFQTALEIYQSDIDQFGYQAEVGALKMSLKTVH